MDVYLRHMGLVEDATQSSDNLKIVILRLHTLVS